MSKKINITVDKEDGEFFILEIGGRFEKSEMRSLIQKLDNLAYQ